MTADRISVGELQELLAAGRPVTVLDVRSPSDVDWEIPRDLSSPSVELAGRWNSGALFGDSLQAGSDDASSTSVVAYGTASSRSFGIGFPDNSLTPVSAILNPTKGSLDLCQRDAIDFVFVRLDIEIVETRRIVARVTDARLFPHGLLAVAAPLRHAGLDGLAFRLESLLEVAKVLSCHHFTLHSPFLIVRTSNAV